MAETKRYEGTVKWFSGQKGFGFIAAVEDSGEDLFVHQSEIKAEGFRFLRDGQRVEFSVESGEDGRKKAVDVVGRTRPYSPGLRRGGRGRRGGYGGNRGGFRGGGNSGRGGGFGRGGGNDSDGGRTGGRECYNCGLPGHFARDCYQDNDQGSDNEGYDNGRSGGRGTRGGGGRGTRGGGGRGGRSRQCYHCGEEGHFARECPNDQD